MRAIIILCLLLLCPLSAGTVEKIFHYTNAGCTAQPVLGGFTCTFPTPNPNVPLYYATSIEFNYVDAGAGACTGYIAVPQVCNSPAGVGCGAAEWYTIASPTVVAGVATLNPLSIRRNVDATDRLSYTIGTAARAIRFVVTPFAAGCGAGDLLSIYVTLSTP